MSNLCEIVHQLLYIDDQLDTVVTALVKEFSDDIDLASKNGLLQLNEAKSEILNYNLDNFLMLR